jgi:hypothetical protein
MLQEVHFCSAEVMMMSTNEEVFPAARIVVNKFVDVENLEKPKPNLKL